jgi:hypothetical protein
LGLITSYVEALGALSAIDELWSVAFAKGVEPTEESKAKQGGVLSLLGVVLECLNEAGNCVFRERSRPRACQSRQACVPLGGTGSSRNWSTSNAADGLISTAWEARAALATGGVSAAAFDDL